MRKEQGSLRILIADDHDIVRHGLRALLEAQEGWTVCGEAVSGREAVEMAENLQPDVAVLDISMPSLNGLDATRIIRKASPKTEILIFTMHETEQLVREVLAAGAKGYLLKSDAGRSVVAAVAALAAHQPYFNWKVNETILDGFLRASAPIEAPAQDQEALTTREREVVQLLAEGLSNKEVAKRLELSVKTVETHRSSSMRKLNAHSVVGLVRYAVRNKLTPI
jgi:DNA-binding NarL/FixJ family response regulator